MMKINKLGVVAGVALLLVVAGCDDDPAKGATKVEATAAQPVKAEPAKGAVKYAFNQDNSKTEFVGAKVSAKHEGSFGAFAGTIQLVDGGPLKSTVRAEIAMDSLKVEPDKLAGHLKSKDFFEVEKYPKAVVTSTAIKAGGEKGASHTVTGNLEMHGVTKSITFPATIAVAGDSVAVRAEFAINRKDFGVVYPGMPDDLIKDEFLIRLNIAAKKAADQS